MQISCLKQKLMTKPDEEKKDDLERVTKEIIEDLENQDHTVTLDFSIVKNSDGGYYFKLKGDIENPTVLRKILRAIACDFKTGENHG